MSVIHSALKKAEAEQQKRLEPYNLSIDAIVELAQKKPKAAEPAPVVRIRQKQKLSRPFKIFLLTFVGAVALSWSILSMAKHLSLTTHHEAPAPAVISQKADGLKYVMARKRASVRKKSARAPLLQKVASVPPVNFFITGVVTSGGHWSAMINNKLVEVGSVVDGARVVSIYEGSATLELNGKRFTIYLD